MNPTEALLTAVLHLYSARKASPYTIPLPVPAGRVTSAYGMRADPLHGANAFHDGIDIAAPAGSAIYAVAAGQVVFLGDHKGYGRVLGVRHNHDVTTLYAHCWATKVSVGDVVEAGTVLGYVGDSGRATGPHLHFEVRVKGKSVDPLMVTGAVSPRPRG